MSSSNNADYYDNSISSIDMSDSVSPEQRKEQQRRNDFLKQSVQDMNSLYESLGKHGRAMKIRPENEYWIFEAKPEKSERENIRTK